MAGGEECSSVARFRAGLGFEEIHDELRLRLSPES